MKSSRLLNTAAVSVLAGALLLAPLSQAAATVVGQWNFEEGTAGNPISGVNSVLDQSGNTNHGSPTGNPAYSGDTAPGGGATSASFDGNGDYVSISHSASLNLVSAFTVEFRMKAGSTGNSGLRLLVDKSHGFIDSTGWTFQTVNGIVHLNVGASGSFPGGASTTNVLDNQWHHIAGTYDITDVGQELKLYIDGVLEGAFNVGTYTANLRDVVIGAACVFPGCIFGPQRFYNGLVDDLRISDTALTTGQFLNGETEISEPMAIALFGLGLAVMGIARRQCDRRDQRT